METVKFINTVSLGLPLPLSPILRETILNVRRHWLKRNGPIPWQTAAIGSNECHSL